MTDPSTFRITIQLEGGSLPSRDEMFDAAQRAASAIDGFESVSVESKRTRPRRQPDEVWVPDDAGPMGHYCRACDGYTAEVGKLEESGWCERCSYRDALQQIAKLCEGSWHHEQVRDIAVRVLRETSS
jgi:hypothetical protein